MEHYEVVREVAVEQVVIIEAESETDARQKAWELDQNEIPYSQEIEVREVTSIRK